MAHLRWTESDVLEEFGRIMTEQDGLKKVAQVAALSPEEFEKLQADVVRLQQQPKLGQTMEYWIGRLRGQTEPGLKMLHDNLSKRYELYLKDAPAAQINAVPLTSAPATATQTPMPEPKVMPVSAPVRKAEVEGEQTEKTAAVDKTAEEKKYEVQPDSDMVGTAHPGKAMVNGDLVENLEQQQAADLAVARKSAKVKEVLAELYKMAKKLQAEKNDVAYELVKKAFQEIAATLKK